MESGLPVGITKYNGYSSVCDALICRWYIMKAFLKSVTNVLFKMPLGFLVTLKHLFKKPVTLDYPRKKKPMSPRYRGRHYLERYDVFSIGRYGSWEYMSMEDTLLQGKKVAEALHG